MSVAGVAFLVHTIFQTLTALQFGQIGAYIYIGSTAIKQSIAKQSKERHSTAKHSEAR